jgi:hypothetical protein
MWLHPSGVCSVHPSDRHDGCVSEVVEITLRCRGASRLTAGFAGWEVEADGPFTILRRVDATPADVRVALVEIADLGLELESLRRPQPSP